MPVISRQDLPKREGDPPGLQSCVLIGAAQASGSLHIEEVTIAPEARRPRSINPQSEMAVIVEQGRVDAILGRNRMTIDAGHVVLVPAGTAHGFLNRYAEPARLLLIFPTHQVEPVPVSVGGATLGFPSEKGLSGYQSPQDRPLQDRR